MNMYTPGLEFFRSIRTLTVFLLLVAFQGGVFLVEAKHRLIHPLVNSVCDSSNKTRNVSSLNYIFQDHTFGYQLYRIPTIVKTQSGKLLVFAEARKQRSNGDSGDIDLVMKSSTDNGKTWSEMTVIWDDGANTCGNPVPIVDAKSGKIHLMMSWNHGNDKRIAMAKGTSNDTRRVYYTCSEDEGGNWSEPTEVTGQVKSEKWDWYGTGPVHGIQLTTGKKKGRLIVPSYFTKKGDGKASYAHVIFSDDDGKTWHAGKPADLQGGGECTVAELAGGDLMLNIRYRHAFVRYYAISDDGGETWSTPEADHSLVDSKCQGSLLSFKSKGKFNLLFANPASEYREKLTIKLNDNEDKSWNKSYLVYNGPSAYSDMVKLEGDFIALVFEGGKRRWSEGIAFKVISLSEFSSSDKGAI
ncbi:exo-alpha-sialidase [Parapedobacter deserti]|uniref:exo-alpha-sialidase n=1 Tax=Parapedobacter deserti TaxID=1912957 RepID=A0ABV7JKK7_9SPHI